MNLFALAGLSLGVSCFLLAIVILINSKRKLHYVWALFNISVALFGFGSFLVGIAKEYESALLAWRIFWIGLIFISVFFYHLVKEFCEYKETLLLRIAYALAFVFAALMVLTNLMNDEFLQPFGFYYVKANVVNTFFFFLWSCLSIFAFVRLYKYKSVTKGVKRVQALYLFYGMMLGFISGSTTALPCYGINVYPAWHFFICVYAAISTYAIFKYQLMDIRIAVTRIGVLIVVYSLVLGVPFGLLILGKSLLINIWGEHWFWAPMLTLLVFATAGPFTFLHFQRKAEEALLQEDQRTQDLLMQASYGMNTIHNLQRLLELIVTIVVRTLRVDEGKIYLLNQEADKYELKIPAENNGLVIDRDAPLIEQLRQKQYPVIHDEMKMLSEMNGEAGLKEVENKMRELSAHMIVPITLKDSLIGFLALGERDSKDMYSRGLLNALSVLGRNAGLAIDRCNYIEIETKRLEEESLKERIVSLDHMASSMAHEIDNPMVGVHSSLEYIRNILMRDPRVYIHEAVKEEWDETINRGLHCAERVSGMVKAILDYSRMGKGELKPVVIKEAVEGFQQLIGPEKKTEKVHLVVELEDNLPPILGDRIKLEQIFVNFVRNAIHAVKHKEQEERNVTLRIYKKDYKTIRVECIDNGYGIEKKLLNDMFLANTTTKGSSEGTGMGLYIVRQTVTTFGGRVWAESEGKDKGARLIAELPTYDGDRIAKIDTLKPKKEEKNGKDGQSKNQSPGA